MITSPSNHIYIGQSINIISRFSKYKNLRCKDQFKLYISLKKYGSKAHVITIIHSFEYTEYTDNVRILLNYWERYYISRYQSFGTKWGLNLTSGGDVGSICSEETKKKRSDSLKGRKRDPEKSERAAQKNRGQKRTPEQIKNISDAHKGQKPWCTGKKFTEEHKQHLKDAWKPRKVWNKGIKMTEEQKCKLRGIKKVKLMKKVIDIETGIIYESVMSAAEMFNISKNSLCHMLLGYIKNKTNLRYLKEQPSE